MDKFKDCKMNQQAVQHRNTHAAQHLLGQIKLKWAELLDRMLVSSFDCSLLRVKLSLTTFVMDHCHLLLILSLMYLLCTQPVPEAAMTLYSTTAPSLPSTLSVNLFSRSTALSSTQDAGHLFHFKTLFLQACWLAEPQTGNFFAVITFNPWWCHGCMRFSSSDAFFASHSRHTMDLDHYL